MPKIYPGWVMRLYYDLDKNDPTLKDLCNLACHDVNIDICDVKNLPGTPFKDAAGIFAMNWRFFPTLDPQVCRAHTYTHIITYRKSFFDTV